MLSEVDVVNQLHVSDRFAQATGVSRSIVDAALSETLGLDAIIVPNGDSRIKSGELVRNVNLNDLSQSLSEKLGQSPQQIRGLFDKALMGVSDDKRPGGYAVVGPVVPEVEYFKHEQ